MDDLKLKCGAVIERVGTRQFKVEVPNSFGMMTRVDNSYVPVNNLSISIHPLDVRSLIEWLLQWDK